MYVCKTLSRGLIVKWLSKRSRSLNSSDSAYCWIDQSKFSVARLPKNSFLIGNAAIEVSRPTSAQLFLFF